MTKTSEKWAVPWSGRGDNYTAAEIAAVVQAMRDADPLTQGRYQAEFEAKFERFQGSGRAFAVSSATAALELAALLARVGPGDDVVLPAHTFAATAIPFGRTGARLVWADIDPATRVVTAEILERVLTPRTKVLIVVHLYGLVCDMDPILDLARRRKLLVVEDAAQAVGTRYKGRRAGSMGDFGVFSFHTHKNISTLGEGGMLTVRDERLARLVPGLRHNGVRPFERQSRYWLPAMSDVDFDIEGLWPYNFCLGEPQCALGSKLLDRLDKTNARRRKRGLKIRRALADFPELSFQALPEGCEHSFHLLAARYDGPRDAFIDRMACKHRVKVIQQYHPLYRYPLFKKAGFGAARCPNTDAFYDQMVSFPFHLWLKERQIDLMIAATRETMSFLRRGSVKKAAVQAAR